MENLPLIKLGVKNIKTMEFKVTFTASAEFNVCVEADDVTTAKNLAVKVVESHISLDHTLNDFTPSFKKEIKFTQPLFLTRTTMLGSEIMRKSNKHDNRIVDEINRLWNSKRDGFKHILMSFMVRDVEEMYSHNCFGACTNTDLDIPTFRGYIENNWVTYAELYLNRVACDTDLNMILAFVNMTAMR